MGVRERERPPHVVQPRLRDDLAARVRAEPQSQRDRRNCFGGSRLTLEQRLDRVWEGLRAAGAAECPLCGGCMQAAAGHARCSACGSTLT